ncbi:MAG: flagellar FlbD family protein [Bryobacteraceae bacterium]|nr:flagellar FlbD family protein [Bryobacteraceae bacterium]
MIRLTRLNHAPLVLNSDLIAHVEETPDTVITLTCGQVFRVLETADEIIERVCAFRRAVYRDALRCPIVAPHSETASVTGDGR